MQNYEKSSEEQNKLVFIFISRPLHQQEFEHWYLDTSTVQGQKSVSLHLVKGMTDVQSTVVEFCCYLVHQNIERLRTGRVVAA